MHDHDVSLEATIVDRVDSTLEIEQTYWSDVAMHNVQRMDIYGGARNLEDLDRWVVYEYSHVVGNKTMN